MILVLISKDKLQISKQCQGISSDAAGLPGSGVSQAPGFQKDFSADQGDLISEPDQWFHNSTKSQAHTQLLNQG